MTAPKSLSEIRDELAVSTHHACAHVFDGNPDPIDMYKAGFDASSKVWAERCDRLVKALEKVKHNSCCIVCSPNCPSCEAHRAINKHRLFIEGSKK